MQFAQVCGLLGWVGAITCGVMLILMYWDVIVNTSVFLAIAAAVLPFAGFILPYFIAKVVCFVSNTDEDNGGWLVLEIEMVV